MLYKTKFAQDNRIINLDKCFVIQRRTTDEVNMIMFGSEKEEEKRMLFGGGETYRHPPNFVLYDTAELVELEMDEIMKFTNGGK